LKPNRLDASTAQPELGSSTGDAGAAQAGRPHRARLDQVDQTR